MTLTKAQFGYPGGHIYSASCPACNVQSVVKEALLGDSSAPEIEPLIVDGRLALAWKTFLLNRGAMSESYYEVARIAFVVAWHAGFSERTNSAPETTVPEKVCRWSPIEEGSLTYQPGCGGEWWTKSERLVELYDYCHHCGGRIEEVSADESPTPTQWAVESAAMLAAGEWLKKPSADRTPLLLQDYADHYALKINVPAVMVRSTARELLKTRVGISIEVYPLTVAVPGDGG